MKSLRITALLLLLSVDAVVAAPHDETPSPGHVIYKVDKNDHVKIGDRLATDTVVIPKGQYLLTHHLEGERHLIVLTAIPAKNGAAGWTREFVTQLIAEDRVVTRSTLFADELPDGSLRLSAIQIAGEAGDHIEYNGPR